MIVPAHTFVATAEAVTQAGATPVLADVTDADGTLDPAAASAAVSPRTRAILPVHLYGHMADMRALLSMARRNGAVVIEDACQAHGAARAGLGAGAGGLASGFSFYPAKNLGAFGDAGAVSTDDTELADRVRTAAPARRDHEVPPRRRGRHRPPGHDSGHRASAQASAARRLE